MKEDLFVSNKGQITLPAAMRKALGLHGNAIVTAEAQGGRIMISPAMVVETELWSDEQVRSWAEADTFAPDEREALAARVARTAAPRKRRTAAAKTER